MKGNNTKSKGITLIALVITIVILIILAGVVIALSLGENGIFNKAKYAKEQYEVSSNEENVQLAELANSIDGYVDSTNRAGLGTYTLLSSENGTGSDKTGCQFSEPITNYKALYVVIYGINHGTIEKYILATQFIYNPTSLVEELPEGKTARFDLFFSGNTAQVQNLTAEGYDLYLPSGYKIMIYGVN